MSHPFFSIVIPAYNRADLIGLTLDSVLGQVWMLLHERLSPAQQRIRTGRFYCLCAIHSDEARRCYVTCRPYCSTH